MSIILHTILILLKKRYTIKTCHLQIAKICVQFVLLPLEGTKVTPVFPSRMLFLTFDFLCQKSQLREF